MFAVLLMYECFMSALLWR